MGTAAPLDPADADLVAQLPGSGPGEPWRRRPQAEDELIVPSAPRMRRAARTVVLPGGAEAYDRARALVFRWGIQTAARLEVSSDHRLVEEGAVALVRLGVGPLAVRAPVRVVWTADDLTLAGFGYETLPGHPVSGVEWFVLALDEGGVARLTISSVSRPAWRSARVVSPLARAGQRLVLARYVRAFSRHVARVT